MPAIPTPGRVIHVVTRDTTGKLVHRAALVSSETVNAAGRNLVNCHVFYEPLDIALPNGTPTTNPVEFVRGLVQLDPHAPPEVPARVPIPSLFGTWHWPERVE